jgi:hypothetical protein
MHVDFCLGEEPYGGTEHHTFVRPDALYGSARCSQVSRAGCDAAVRGDVGVRAPNPKLPRHAGALSP